MRRVAALVTLALLAAVLPFVAGSPAQADPPTHMTGYIPVAVGTPDEALLHYKVMLPPGADPDGRYPTVIDYSGYVPALNVYDGLDDRFTALGYAVVGLNIRGSACSSGTFDYFEPRQSIDGVEAIDWLADQPWSNGRFGMVGKSYPGITQLFVAGARAIPNDGDRDQAWVDGVLADHLAAIVPGHVFGDLYRDVPYPGGIQNVTFAGGWSAQRVYEGYAAGPEAYFDGDADEQCLQNQAQHALNPPFNPFVHALQPQNNFDSELFHERSPFWWADQIETPTFLVESWQDEQVGSRATHLIERFRPDLTWKFLGTNGDHGEYYGPDVFPHIARFLDYHLRGQVPVTDHRAAAGEPATTQTLDASTDPVAFEQALTRYVAEDKVIINWEVDRERRAGWATTHASWPVPELTADRLYATDGGELVPTIPAVPGSVDYVYSPELGSQQRGGYDLAGEQPASWDGRPAPGMSAMFTTAPLTEDKVLLGTASIDLHLSSTAPDTDLEITLSEVRPDGKEVFVQQGWLRASHRKEHPELSTELRPFQTHQVLDSLPLVPGAPTLVRAEIFPFGHTFREGSQVRITVAAPHVHPDLWGFTALPVPAVNTIHTGGVTASSVALPLVSGAKAGVRALPTCGDVHELRNQPCRDGS